MKNAAAPPATERMNNEHRGKNGNTGRGAGRKSPRRHTRPPSSDGTTERMSLRKRRTSPPHAMNTVIANERERVSGPGTHDRPLSSLRPPRCEVHTTEVVCFLWREAQPLSLTSRSHAQMSTCYERQPERPYYDHRTPDIPQTTWTVRDAECPQTPKDPRTPQISKKIRPNEKPTAEK